jgi:ERCC4-related helicase
MCSNTVHVSPVNDLIAHDLETDDCVCIPRAEAVHRADGSVGWVLVHHSLDGREFHEQKGATT